MLKMITMSTMLGLLALALGGCSAKGYSNLVKVFTIGEVVYEVQPKKSTAVEALGHAAKVYHNKKSKNGR
jgi:hypothetical protein